MPLANGGRLVSIGLFEPRLKSRGQLRYFGADLNSRQVYALRSAQVISR
jgi:hypothetical protein